MLLRWVGAGVTFIHFVSFSWQPFISIIAVHSTAKEDWLVGWLVGWAVRSLAGRYGRKRCCMLFFTWVRVNLSML